MPSNIILLLEGEAGCLMVRLPAVSDCAKITAWTHEHVAEADLAADGYENDAHVTVAHGFTPDVKPQEVSEVITKVAPEGVNIRLGAITFFDTDPEHDVLKVEVESEEMETLHYALRKAFGKRLDVSFPIYHGHLTLAYVKKGKCRDLLNNASFAGWAFKCDKFVYSTPGMKTNYVLPSGEPGETKALPQNAGGGSPVVSGEVPVKPSEKESADIVARHPELQEASTFHPDLLDAVHKFENGELNPQQTIAMFKKMVNCGMKLVGVYGRMATNLIRKGLIDPPKEKKSDPVKKQVAAESLLSEIADNPPVMPDSFFRKLSPKEEAKFRQYAREHRAELEKMEVEGKLGLCHPSVRSEFRKMKNKHTEAVESTDRAKQLVAALLEDEGADPRVSDDVGDDDSADAYAEMQQDLEDGDCYAITDCVRGGYNLVGPKHQSMDWGQYAGPGRRVAHLEDFDTAIKQMVDLANSDQYWPNVYSINDHGNVTQLIMNWDDGTYTTGKGWV